MGVGKVTFVFPRFKYPSGDFSIGLAYISAYLKKTVGDVEAHLIDPTFDPSLSHIAARLAETKPDIVGIYMDTLMYEDALRVARVAKSLSAYVVVGGPHPSILPMTVISSEYVDSVCIGEGEIAFAALVREYFDQRRFDLVEGIWYKQNGSIVKNPPQNPIEDLDSLPYPDLEIFDIERYIDNFIQLDSYCPKIRGLSVIVSRGCPFRCSYCQPTLSKVFGKKFRIRSPGNVVGELRNLTAKYRLDAVYFQDDTLTVSRDWLLEFCDLLIAEKLGIVWACNTRADTVDEQMLSTMKRAGLVKLKVGIESKSDRVRKEIYRKGISLAQVDRMIRMARDLQIQVAGFFMLGAPTETNREIIQTIRYAVGSDLVEANFSITVPLPATDLHEMAQGEGWMLPPKFEDYDYYHAIRPPITREDVSSRRLQLYKKLAYLLFYLHRKRIMNTLQVVWGGRAAFRKTLQKLRRF